MNINTDTPAGRDRYNRAVRAQLLIMSSIAAPVRYSGDEHFPGEPVFPEDPADGAGLHYPSL
jgi:hypothetical protein